MCGAHRVPQSRGLELRWHRVRGRGSRVIVHRAVQGPVAHCSPCQLEVRVLQSICRAVGEELGGLARSGRDGALRLLTQFEEHFLLPLLLVQILFQSLLSWPKLVPPLLQVLVMVLIQGLQLLGFMLYQEVTLFILQLLQLARVALALRQHVPHLVLMFLLLLQPL